MRRARGGQQAYLSRGGAVPGLEGRKKQAFLKIQLHCHKMGLSSKPQNRTSSSKLKKMMLESNYSEVRGPCLSAEGPNLISN